MEIDQKRQKKENFASLQINASEKKISSTNKQGDIVKNIYFFFRNYKLKKNI